MSDSLRDQLLSLGFKPAPKPERRAGGKKQQGGSRRKPDKASAEIDLAKAYALRQQQEKAERQRAERERQEKARQRREALAQLEKLLADTALNQADAELARHFEYGGRIRRVYVTPEQFAAINAGGLAVVQMRGRYFVVAPEVATQAEAMLEGSVALRVDPSAPEGGDAYADPKYQVPDDLVW